MLPRRAACSSNTPDEGRADAPAFLLGVDDPVERVEELIGCVDVHEVDVALGAQHIDDPVALTATEQTVVDEYAGELIADRRDARAWRRPPSPPRR